MNEDKLIIDFKESIYKPFNGYLVFRFTGTKLGKVGLRNNKFFYGLHLNWPFRKVG